MSRRAALLLAVGLAIVLAGCQRPSLTPQESSTVQALTAHLVPRCVGRYLIDVPADAALFGTLTVQGVAIEAKAQSLDDYRKAMQARRDELRAARSFFGYRFLYADTVIEGIPESRYFVSLGNTHAMTDAERLVETYRWDRGYQIKMQIEASDAKDSSYFKDDPSVRDDPDMTNVLGKARLAVALLSSTRGRADDEIPREPGVCFQGGFLAGKPWERERVFAQFIPAGHDDVSLDMESDSSIRSSTTLLQRASDIHRDMKGFDGRTLRNGSVDLHGIHAEEWLFSVNTELKVRGTYFVLEANSMTSNPQAPLVMLTQKVGTRNNLLQVAHLDTVSLTEGEAVSLWDAITRTLRPRPDGF